MIAAMILLSVCIMLLVMFSIFCALWDIISGRWGKAERERREELDKDIFEDY